MSNLLAFPFKKSYELNLKETVRSYIQNDTDVHPDAFKWDINRWQELRKDGVGGKVHVDRIKAALIYHAQLVAILTKLPTNIQLEIAYAPVFSPDSIPITLRNLAFERASVLFNLASLYAQLAVAEDRSNEAGCKRAKVYFESAAGTLSYLIEEALPKLVYTPEDEEIPLDLSQPCLEGFKWLMLAEAQECAWQVGISNNTYKHGVIAKLATEAAKLYRSSSLAIRNATPSIKHIFPSDWLPHLDAKSHHFHAAAQYRKSVEDLDSNRYGYELARLNCALTDAKKGYEIARNGSVASPVVHDVKALLDNVQKNIARAERDNDLIYHDEVPNEASLPNIVGAMMAASRVPAGLSDPVKILGNEAMIFGEMFGWGAKEAINMYNENKQTLIKDRIIDQAQIYDDQIDAALQRLSLPSSLEALERPIGLPPSLLRKAEEVRTEDGPARVETSIESVSALAQQVVKILNEAMDILDTEASEDEAVRKSASVTRPPSHEANREFIEKEKRYRGIIEQAAASDELVRRKWDEWESNIVELTWDEADLEKAVPSSTASRSSTATITRTHAQKLRALLEELDDLIRHRAQLVERAKRRAETDDIQERIVKKAAGFERWVQVQPVMFADDSDEELAKYDKFIDMIEETEGKQLELLEAVEAQNEVFLLSRKGDPSIKEREHALQSLDLAYHKYREITRNLDEGIKFYNDLSAILMQFKEMCKTWTSQRKHEIHLLTKAMRSLDVAPESSSPADSRIQKKSPPAHTPEPVHRQAKKTNPGLPSLSSDEWSSFVLPPGPSGR